MAGSAANGPSRRAARRTIKVVSEIEEDNASLTLLPADEAARWARPLPSDADLAMVDVTDDEWDAFDYAIASR